MKTFSRGTRCAAICALSFSFVVSAFAEGAKQQPTNGFRRAPSETLENGISPVELDAYQRELHSWLVGQVPGNAEKAGVSVSLTDRDRLDLGTPYIPGSRTPMRVGVVKQLSETVGFARGRSLGVNTARGKKAASSTYRQTPDGGFVWTTSLTSPDALAIRVHFENFAMPASAEVYIYGPNGDARGPYVGCGPDGTGEFWSHSINASTVVVVLRQVGPANPTELANLSLAITAIGHVAIDFPSQVSGQAGSAASFCTYNAACVENNACTSDPAVNVAEGAAAKMRWISGAFINICSGSLIADTDGSSQIPYFMTANHCISRKKDARNMEAFFLYQASCGTTNCPSSFGQPSTPASTLGADVLATGSTGDFTLMELNQTPQAAGISYLGWNSTPVAFSSGTALHRVSHPSGAPQAYSQHAVNTTAGECISTARGSWIYSDDIIGATEGGSSGSSVVNAAGEFVGQLTGCCPTGGGDCANVCGGGTFTIDGALAFYFADVADFLDPAGCTPSPEICDNGIDDDCDGDVDCADADCSGDPACSGGGCTLALKGDPCNVDADCCSGICKRNGSCR